MKKIFFIMLCSFISISASEIEEIYSKVDALMHSTSQNYPAEFYRDFILDLREDIVSLGYDVPTIEELILSMDVITGEKGISTQLMSIFYPEKSYESQDCQQFTCIGSINTQQPKKISWGNAAIGGVEMLAGGLCLIIPHPAAKWAGIFLIENGIERILDDVAEQGKINERMQRDI